MPRHRPPTSGYARLSQADEEGYLDESDEDEDPRRIPRTISTISAPQYAPIQPEPPRSMQANPVDAYPKHHRKNSSSRRRMRRRSSSGVDIKAINARLEKWAEEIASKFKINRVKGKTHQEEHLEIKHSVFQAPEGLRPASSETLVSEPESEDRTTKMQFDDIVESVNVAIELGIHPKRISQGSSGSYFARNSDGKVVGVFKPKDEEPYASRNPKWTKWIHRNLFPCFFGRACLIPNLSYVSEAAAYTLDQRLQTNIVPYTDIVHFSSKSFHYDFWDRSAYYRKRKALPAKVGSFQVFLKGFKDANLFFRDHPWPDHTSSGFSPEDAPKWRKSGWTEACRPGSATSEEGQQFRSEVRSLNNADGSEGQGFMWTDHTKQSFREQLEKLVILDYIMRNTDRGLDNWMVRVDRNTGDVSIVSRPPKMNGDTEDAPTPLVRNSSASPYRRQEDMSLDNGRKESESGGPSISLGAIDNSLSWPWKHPDAWRSFPFGWLFLPVSLIGQPFSQKTRDHFLPLLTSTQWWSETQLALRRVFSQDSDFKERMFARQIAVMKGQAWNVVETLKTRDHGPLELTRRTRVCVWDDLVDIPVAIPMRTPSNEMRRRRDEIARQEPEEEEMDISTANGPVPEAQPDLLGSPSDLPNPSRFDLARNNSGSDIGQLTGPSSPATIDGPSFNTRISIEEPKFPLSKSQTSKGRPPRLSSDRRKDHRRHSSSGRYGSMFLSDADDLEGDLGYSAAEVMEGNQRKVIMERLETVKSKNPVFTWC